MTDRLSQLPSNISGATPGAIPGNPVPPVSADPLAGLRDIHLPESIGWWPPAPGWWLLLGGSMLIIAAIYVWLHWRAKQSHPTIVFSNADIINAALLELNSIEQLVASKQTASKQAASKQTVCKKTDADCRPLIADISQLLRRSAMQLSSHDPAHEHNQTAGLTGAAWLAWLDSRWDRHDFTQAAGKALTAAPYRQNSTPFQSSTNDDVAELCHLSRAWLEHQR